MLVQLVGVDLLFPHDVDVVMVKKAALAAFFVSAYFSWLGFAWVGLFLLWVLLESMVSMSVQWCRARADG